MEFLWIIRLISMLVYFYEPLKYWIQLYWYDLWQSALYPNIPLLVRFPLSTKCLRKRLYRCWWQRYGGGHQHPKFVTNVNRHQHRCAQIAENSVFIKWVSEMRYNHFTYVDREIAYFDLLDMSYQVFCFNIWKCMTFSFLFSHPTPFLSFQNQTFQVPSGHIIGQ